MSWWWAIAVAWGVMAVAMFVLWRIAMRRRNAAVVDAVWSVGTGVCGAWFAWSATDGDPARRWLIGALVALWGLRLGSHLIARLTREGEDRRYTAFREQWGDDFDRRMGWFFQLQAVWSVGFAIPMLVAAHRPVPELDVWDLAGVLVWVIAVGGEFVADRQLARFVRTTDDPKGVCQAGLWRYSRHPNYFFEWVHWFAYVAIGIAWTWGWITLLGPVVMYVFLTRVTGIPLAERSSVARRGDAYRRYQRTTNAFFPGPPRPDPEATATSESDR